MPGLKTARSTKPQFSAMSDFSLIKGSPNRIWDWLILLLVGSPASLSRSQAKEKVNLIPATSGRKRLKSFAWYDRDTSCWRMWQGCLGRDTLEPYSETWSKAGMMQNGVVYPQRKSEQTTNGNGSGLWPTPTNSMMTIGDLNQARFAGNNPDRPSYQEANRLATPQSRDYRTGSKKRWEQGKKGIRSCNLNDQVGGKLNPDWVEWLMDVPLGWTSLEPLSKEAVADWLDKTLAGEWWLVEPDIPRITDQKENRVSRLKALGNGIVAECLGRLLSD